MRVRLPGDPHYDYQVARSNYDWPDHIERFLVTGGVLAWCQPDTVCDPACGDATVVTTAYRFAPFSHAYLSDISVPNIEKLAVPFPHTKKIAPIEEGIVSADVCVLTEVLEHLDDPDAVLRLARGKCSRLIASSPLDEKPTGNREHLWSWDEEGYEEMLTGAGWTPSSKVILSWPTYPYTFQIWSAR